VTALPLSQNQHVQAGFFWACAAAVMALLIISSITALNMAKHRNHGHHHEQLHAMQQEHPNTQFQRETCWCYSLLFRDIWTNPEFVKLALSRALYEAGLGVTQLHLFLLMDVVGAHNTEQAGEWLKLSSYVDSTCVIISAIITALLSDRKRERKPFIYLSTVLYIITFICLPHIKNTRLFLLVPSTLFGIAHGIQKSVDFALLVDVIGADRARVGTYVGGWAFAGTFGSAAMGFVYGPVLDCFVLPAHQGHAIRHSVAGYVLAYTCIASLCMISSAFMVFLMKQTADRSGSELHSDVADRATTTSLFESDDAVKICADSRLGLNSRVRGGGTEQSSRFIVTGGFFDDTPDGFIGQITLFRDVNGEASHMCFDLLQIVHPADASLSLANKGLGGACWYEGNLWTCFPNQVVVFRPPSEAGGRWDLIHTIDHESFNDLHHVSVAECGVIVANTGNESVDLFTFDGTLKSRVLLVDADLHRQRVVAARDAMQDYRMASTKANIPHQVHVNHVKHLSGLRVMATLLGNPDEQLPGMISLRSMLGRAGDLKNGALVEIDFGNMSGISANHISVCQTVFKFDSYVHDGIPSDMPQPQPGLNLPRDCLWFTTVVGECIVIDRESATEIKRWRIYDRPGSAIGWTRGLLPLVDGFLVGTTEVKSGSSAANYFTWPWADRMSSSKTAVTFAPFSDDQPCIAVDISSVGGGRFAASKIFSILAWDEDRASSTCAAL
jgi:MFS family permease